MTRPNPLSQALHETGTRLTKSANERMADAKPWRPAALYANPFKVSPRWPFACARIGRICEGANGGRGRSFHEAVKTATMPGLALKFLETKFYYMTKDRPWLSPKKDHNPFRGMPDKEAMRKFMRLVEDICDESTGQLGSWYLK